MTRADGGGTDDGDGGRDRGTVTAELALGLPAVVLMLAALLSLAAVVTAHVQCVDAARAAARAAARGDSPAAVRAIGQELAPAVAVVQLGMTADRVTVGVAARVRLVLPGGPSVRVAASATADRESGNGAGWGWGGGGGIGE